LKRFLKRLLQVTVVLSVIAGAVGAWGYRKYVVDEPGPEFTRAHVLEIISQESPVYYRDGVTPMGVFFDQEHRSYVPFAQLPADWVGAIIAAEDGNFWLHPGVDPKHIVRAVVQNAQAGSVVAGGSTLTQQTAKNLFYRPDRSLRAKAVELVDALRLEAHFSKEDILEFYANQFHVSANGRGIGIAARYFFDKTPELLTTKECAFIAGMVKAPSRYNPFIGQSEERREAAREAAELRTAYVLRRMVATGFLSEGRRQGIAAEPLAFRRGSFRYDRSVVLDEVQRRLEQPEFIELFEKSGIDNPSTAGLRIITTVDERAERAAIYGLWHHLTELGGDLERPGAAALIVPTLTQVEASPTATLPALSFHTARITAAGPAGVQLDVAGRVCTVDEAGITRIATAVGEKSAGVLAVLEAGKFVLASVRPDGAGCDLELRPRLQGAVLVLENGEIRAMVGGNDNRNLNRVTGAQRQFGSTWKPLLFLKSVELGWLPTDVLDNRRNVFPFRGVWYYPRADHASDPFLTMAATGARSENLATVWLLYHLVDRVDEETLRRLAVQADLWPREGEAPAEFSVRMRDEAVLRSGAERFPEFAFTRARADVVAALARSRHPEDALAVRSLMYGYGASAEQARVARTQASAERESRLVALENTFLSVEERGARCLEAPLSTLQWDPLTQDLACGRAPAGFEPLPPEALAVATADRVGDALSDEGKDDLLIDGRMHYGTLRRLRAALDVRLAQLEGQDPWSPEVLLLHPDWRTLVGVRTFARAARDVGVQGALPENLTLPLGAADVTLAEMAGAYQVMLGHGPPRFRSEGYGAGSVTGLRSTFVLPENSDSTALIAEIRDAGGNVIFRMRPADGEPADPRPGAMVGDILRSAVLHGTGRRAAAPAGLEGRPLAGKTGTTNDYRNAAFIGFAPIQNGGAATWGQAFTVAAYVGYDDNTSMRRGRLRVQGASGALPAWLSTVRGMAEAGLLGKQGLADFGVPEGLVRVDAPEGAGFDGALLTALRPAGDPPSRIVGGAAASIGGGAADAPPSGALVLPTDAEYGPPGPDEGVDPAVAMPIDEEPTWDDLLGEDLLLPE
jgi:penicillin-binding protein 1A